jgi:type IV pilus biogenesis protein CpaD/CtpE
MGTASFASASDDRYTAKINMKDLTGKQKVEMKERKAQFNALQKKWAALTDAQKEEIYALKDKEADIRAQIIDKYLEWGIINKAAAADMKKKITENKTNMRKNDKMPMPGCRDKCGKDGNKRIPLTDNVK